MNIEAVFASMVAMARTLGPGVAPRAEGFQMAWDQSGAGDRPADPPARVSRTKDAPEGPAPDAPVPVAPPMPAPPTGTMQAAAPDGSAAPTAAAAPQAGPPPVQGRALQGPALRPEPAAATMPPMPMEPPTAPRTAQTASPPDSETPAGPVPADRQARAVLIPPAFAWPSDATAPSGTQTVEPRNGMPAGAPAQPPADAPIPARTQRDIPPSPAETVRIHVPEGDIHRRPIALDPGAPAPYPERSQDSPSPPAGSARPPPSATPPLAWAPATHPVAGGESASSEFRPAAPAAGANMPLPAAPRTEAPDMATIKGQPAPMPPPSALDDRVAAVPDPKPAADAPAMMRPGSKPPPRRRAADGRFPPVRPAIAARKHRGLPNRSSPDSGPRRTGDALAHPDARARGHDRCRRSGA